MNWLRSSAGWVAWSRRAPSSTRLGSSARRLSFDILAFPVRLHFNLYTLSFTDPFSPVEGRIADRTALGVFSPHFVRSVPPQSFEDIKFKAQPGSGGDIIILRAHCGPISLAWEDDFSFSMQA